MANTANLDLPFLDAAQAQKHVTHNAALAILDALTQIRALDHALAAPPGSPSDGQCWIVAAGGTGAWAGKDHEIAAWQDGAWAFYPPRPGFLAYVDALGGLLVWTGSAWVALARSITSLGNLVALGIATAADPTNPLSGVLNNALLSALPTGSGGTGDLRLKLNKTASVNTVSQLYQDGFSGRAETGLAGDDNFRIKVSPDGATWHDGMIVDRTSGLVSLPAGLTAAGAVTVPGLSGGPLAGFRNRVLNGNFAVNQRVVAGSVSLGAGAYGHDRWKAGASGCAYSFAASGIDTTLTISANTLTQVIEGVNVEGGTYTLSWSGTAQARIYQGSPSGSYAASPITVSGLAAATNTTIEFNAGTLGKAQFEPGATATPFERRPLAAELALCQRYFETSYGQGVAPGTAGSGGDSSYALFGVPSSLFFGLTSVRFKAVKRAVPTMTLYSPNTGASGKVFDWGNGADLSGSPGDIGDSGFTYSATTTTANIGVGLSAHWTAAAEI